MAIEVYERRPAARDGEQIAGQLLTAVEANTRHRQLAVRTRHAHTGAQGDAKRARLICQWRGGTRIDHQALGACRTQRKGGFPGGITAGGYHHLLARADGVAAQILQRGVSKHHARAIVVGEQQRPLDGTGGEHDLPRAHLDQPLGSGPALHQHHRLVIVETHRAGERQELRASRLQRRHGKACPFGARLAFDRRLPPQQRAAGAAALIDQQHTLAAGLRRTGRGNSGGAGTDHADIGMQVTQRRGLRPRGRIDASYARHAADRTFEQRPARPHEGLVVKGRRNESRETVEEGERIARGRAQRVDRGEFHAGHKRLARDARIGVVARAVTQIEDRIRLLETGPQQPARAVVLEAPAQHLHTCRK